MRAVLSKHWHRVLFTSICSLLSGSFSTPLSLHDGCALPNRALRLSSFTSALCWFLLLNVPNKMLCASVQEDLNFDGDAKSCTITWKGEVHPLGLEQHADLSPGAHVYACVCLCVYGYMYACVFVCGLCEVTPCPPFKGDPEPPGPLLHFPHRWY